MPAGYDVAVVGGGPAGLASAISASLAGLSVVLFERADGPPDKACGEWMMPAGVRVLERLGVRSQLGPADCARFNAVRYVQQDGTSARGRLPAPGGLGIRRTALTSALAKRAAQCGVVLRWACNVKSYRITRDAVLLAAAGRELSARVLVAADGLHSGLRQIAGLDGEARQHERFGLRQHFQVAPWSDCVEVHLGEGIEAFVTPAGASRVGLAFLWDKKIVAGPASIDTFLDRFPAVASRLKGAPIDSRPRGAGPLAQSTRLRVAERLVLVGDAAGYVDAVTGEGLSLALKCAEALGRLLPRAIEQRATAVSLRPYERFFSGEFRRYALACRVMLGLSAHPTARRRVVRFLGEHPRVFERLIAFALD